MVKGRVGLPSEFKLNVEKPVEMGDYLDETGEVPSPIRLRKAERTAAKVIEAEQRVVESREDVSVRAVEPPKPVIDVIRLRSKATETKPTVAKKQKTTPRRQINMSPKTLEAFAELVRYVQEYGPQPDAAASEVMDAIVSAHYEARDVLNLGGVPARGRWGSPTSQAFKDALSRAFTNALIEFHAKNEKREASNA
jgi:hypothetical protein